MIRSVRPSLPPHPLRTGHSAARCVWHLGARESRLQQGVCWRCSFCHHGGKDTCGSIAWWCCHHLVYQVTFPPCFCKLSLVEGTPCQLSGFSYAHQIPTFSFQGGWREKRAGGTLGLGWADVPRMAATSFSSGQLHFHGAPLPLEPLLVRLESWSLRSWTAVWCWIERLCGILTLRADSGVPATTLFKSIGMGGGLVGGWQRQIFWTKNTAGL